MTTANEKKLQELVNNVLSSCLGTNREQDVVSQLRLKMKNDLGMRETLVDRFLNNYYA